MNTKPNHIKPVFAPENEFQVQTLVILGEDRMIEPLDLIDDLNLSSEPDFFSGPMISSAVP